MVTQFTISGETKVELVDDENGGWFYEFSPVLANTGPVKEHIEIFLLYILTFKLTTLESWLDSPRIKQIFNFYPGTTTRPFISYRPINPIKDANGSYYMPIEGYCNWEVDPDSGKFTWVIYLTFVYEGVKSDPVRWNLNLCSVLTLSKLIDCVLRDDLTASKYFGEQGTYEDLKRAMGAFQQLFPNGFNKKKRLFGIFIGRTLKFCGDSGTSTWIYIFNSCYKTSPSFQGFKKIEAVIGNAVAAVPVKPIKFIQADRISACESKDSGSFVGSATIDGYSFLFSYDDPALIKSPEELLKDSRKQLRDIINKIEDADKDKYADIPDPGAINIMDNEQTLREMVSELTNKMKNIDAEKKAQDMFLSISALVDAKKQIPVRRAIRPGRRGAPSVLEMNKLSEIGALSEYLFGSYRKLALLKDKIVNVFTKPPANSDDFRKAIKLMCRAELFFNKILQDILSEYKSSNPIKPPLRNKWSELYEEIDRDDFGRIQMNIEAEINNDGGQAREGFLNTPLLIQGDSDIKTNNTQAFFVSLRRVIGEEPETPWSKITDAITN